MFEKLGRYRLLRLIATGGMGEVFLARQEGPAGFAKLVVIKRILRHLANDQGFIDLFLNEARLAALLQHPHIAQVFGLEHEDNAWFIAMEYVHGRSLRDVIVAAKQKGLKVPARLAARLASQALQGLHFAHELTDPRGQALGILHRDVSPENLLVGFAGTLKLVDFGIAKAMSADTRIGRPKGKLAYLAPEATVAGGAVDRRADVYSMGVVLYETLTLQAPPNTPRSTREAQALREPYVSEPSLPPALNQILARAMAAEPARRYANAKEMGEALEQFLADTNQSVIPADVTGFLQALFGEEALGNPALEGPGGAGTDVLSIKGGTQPLSLASLSPVRISANPLPPVDSRRQLWLSVGVGVATALLVGFVLLLAVWPRQPAIVVAPPVPPVAVIASAPPVRPPALVVPVQVEADPEPEPDAGTKGPPPVAPVKPPVVKAPVVKRPVKTGKVTVRVNPWAEVSYGGKNYGATPIPPVEVPAGLATFTLRNSQLGVTRKVSVKVPAGGTVVLKADLFKK